MSEFGNCEKNKEHLVLTEFCKEYNQCDEDSMQKHHLNILKYVFEALVNNDIHRFNELCQLVNCVNNLTSQESLQTNYNHTENPLRGTNIIIIACKENKNDILELILQNDTVFKDFANTIGKNIILSSDKDREDHTAFYYAIRSSNVKLTETLVTKWPGGILSYQLDILLSKAYEELKLKNIQISEQMATTVENKLLNIRFWAEDKNVLNCKIFCKKDIIERITFFLENIRLLQIKYSDMEVDETFLLITKYIAQNLHILKRQLGVTYNTLPWEEMEFCVIAYMNSIRQHNDEQFINRIVLNKKKLLLYLEIFAKYLCVETKRIEYSDARKLKQLPKMKRDVVVANIKTKSPEFENLYKDFEKIRDVHSLTIMNNYLTLAMSADCTVSSGQLVIIRTLHVLGENLKNTLQSPRLSPATSHLLICSLTRTTRKILIQLRDNLSHTHSLLRRMNIEKNDNDFFSNVKNDIERLYDVITDILLRNKISIIKMQLQSISDSSSTEELKKISEPFLNFDLTEIDILASRAGGGDLSEVEELISELKNLVRNQTYFEKEQLNKIHQLIRNEKSNPSNQERNYLRGFLLLKNCIYVMIYSDLDENCLRDVKCCANKALEFLKFEINLVRSLELIKLSKTFAKSVLERVDEEVNNEISCIIYKIIMILECKSDVQWIEEAYYKITQVNENDVSENKNISKTSIISEFDEELSCKILALKGLLPPDFSQNKAIHESLPFKNIKILHPAIEMLLLDILAILEEKRKCLNDNQLFLDEHCPTLLGKSLRNHLAHGNSIINILYSDYLTTLLINTRFFCNNEIVSNKKKIGKIVCSNIVKIQTKCDQDKKITNNQTHLFNALCQGNLNIVKSLIENGADIMARSWDMSTALHYAAKSCSPECVKFVIDQNIITDLKNAKGENALHIAVKYGQKPIINYFIKENSMNVNDTDSSGRTCLHFASQNGFRDIVLLLLKNGANPDRRDALGFSPLHYAVLNNRVNVVEVFLEKLNVSHEAKSGYTLLYIASEKGFLDIVKLLLRNKANVNARNDNLGIPLHIAALNGHMEVVKTLISEGSNVSDQDVNGYTPLHYAVAFGHKHIVEILLEHSPGINLTENSFNRTPLTHAAEYGFTEIVEILLHHGAIVDIACVQGNTALQFAAFKGRIEIVELLIRYGASIDISNKRGCTALHLGSLNGHANVIKYLIEKGAHINAFNQLNETPLHFAVTNGHTDVIEVLLESGANVNIQNYMGNTPLHAYCMNGFASNIQILVKKGANLLIKNGDGQTPLHVAVSSGVWETVETLIAAGADIQISDSMGLSILHHAALHGHEKIVQGLIKTYSNVNVKNENGITPLHLAVIGNHEEVVKILITSGSEIDAMCSGEHSSQFSPTPNLRESFIKLMGESGDINSEYNSLHKSLFVNKFDDMSWACKNKSPNKKYTPLYFAVYNNNIQIVSILLSKGADVNIQQSISTVLAILEGYKDIAEMIIENQNFKINTSHSKDISLLHVAVMKGLIMIVKKLLIKGANVNAEICVSNVTPLHIASEKGHNEIVKILITYGANVNTQTDDGTTALHYAAVAGHEQVVLLLLLCKAKTNIRDFKSRTPLELAVAHGHQKVVEKLLDSNEINENNNGKHFSLLHIAAQKGYLELTKYLTNRGANINNENDLGSKPIHIAARDGHKHIVEYFLNKNMSLEVVGVGGGSLLHYAAQGNQVEVTQFLLEKKANPNKPNMKGSTPMHIAAIVGAKDVVQVLLDNGAFYNALDLLHKSPLQVASTNGIKDLLKTCDELFQAVKHNKSAEIELYIKKYFVVNIKNKSDETPLLYAAWKGYDQVIDLLLRNKANPKIKGKNGSSPLHYACKFSHVNAVKNLLSNGAIYNLKNDKQKTPLDFAENQEIIYLLKLVDETFKNIQNCNLKVISDLQKIVDPVVVKVLMNVNNQKNQTIYVCAVHNDFPKIKKLKQILENDMSTNMIFAEALCGIEKYEEAQQILEREFDKKKYIYGKDNPFSFDTQILIAKTYYKQQRYEKALNMFQDVYEKQSQLFGINNAEVQRTRNGIGLVLHRQGKNKEALAIFREILEIQNELLGASDDDVLDTQINMALVLVELEQNEEALTINYEILEKMFKSLGINDPRTLCVQNNIAMILNNLGKSRDSLKMYEKVYEKRKSILGYGHSDTLRTWYNMGSVLLSQNQHEEALDIFRQVLIIQRQELIPHHPDTINTLFQMGFIFFTQGKFLLALKILNYVQDKKLGLLGPVHPEIKCIAGMIKSIDEKFLLLGYENSIVLQQAENYFQVAASSGDKNIVEMYVACGTDVNSKDCSGRTALHCAAANGHKEVIITLIDKGADCLLVSSGKGNTPLHLAAAKGYEDITEILLMHVKKVKLGKLNYFMNAGTSVLGNTALHLASNVAIVKKLLKYGAVYDIKNKKGETPLDLARDQEISDLLLFIHKLFDDAKVGRLDLIHKVKSMAQDELLALAGSQNKDDMTVVQVAKSNKKQDFLNNLLTVLQKRKCFHLS